MSDPVVGICYPFEGHVGGGPIVRPPHVGGGPIIPPVPPTINPPPSWNPPPWGEQLPEPPPDLIVVPQPPDKPKPPDFPEVWPPIELPPGVEKAWVLLVALTSTGKRGHWVWVDKTKPVAMPPEAQPKR